MVVSHTIGTVLGPIVIGTNVNFFLFGIVLYQFACYFSSQSRPAGNHNTLHNQPPKDPIAIRALVYWLLILDTYHTAVCGYMQWQYTIDHFADPLILQIATWPYSSTPIVTILASVTVQCFLAWRIRIITRRKLWAIIIVILSIIQGLAGLGTGIGALWVSDVSRFWQLEPVAGVWFCTQVACDALITTTLVCTLNNERTGFKHTDNVIDRLIRGAVETACFASLFCLLDLAMFFAESGNNLHLAFALPMGRIYSNTLLATLNARSSHRAALSSTEHGGTYVPNAPNPRRPTGELVLRRSGASSQAVMEKKPVGLRSEGIKVSIQHDVELEPRAPSPPSSSSSVLDSSLPPLPPSPSPAKNPSILVLPKLPDRPAPTYSHSHSHSLTAKSAFSTSQYSLPISPGMESEKEVDLTSEEHHGGEWEGAIKLQRTASSTGGRKAQALLGMGGNRPVTGRTMGLPKNCV